MTCRYCATGDDETQEHMERCEFTTKGLNIEKERDHIVLGRKINTKLYKVHNDVSSIEEKLRKTGLYNPDDSRESGMIRMNRIGQDSREACTNSPDENGETRQLVREVPEYHATVASRVRDMRVDAVIIHPP